MRRPRSILYLAIGAGLTAWFAVDSIQARHNSELISAVERHDAASAEPLLDAGADPSQLISDSDWVASTGVPSGADAVATETGVLIRIKNRINELTHPSWRRIPLLSAAAAFRDPRIALALVAHGAKVNAGFADGSGGPPLMDAACVGNIQLIQVMLRAGANVNAVTRHGGSVVFSAVAGDKSPQTTIQVLTVLVRAGADIRDSGVLTDYRPARGKRDPVVIFLMQHGAEWPDKVPPHHMYL